MFDYNLSSLHTHARTHTLSLSLSLSIYIYIYIKFELLICTYLLTYICMYIYIYIYICVSLSVCVCECLHIQMYVPLHVYRLYACNYVHTHSDHWPLTTGRRLTSRCSLVALKTRTPAEPATSAFSDSSPPDLAVSCWYPTRTHPYLLVVPQPLQII